MMMVMLNESRVYDKHEHDGFDPKDWDEDGIQGLDEHKIKDDEVAIRYDDDHASKVKYKFEDGIKCEVKAGVWWRYREWIQSWRILSKV